jgi:uncharacterized protein with PIN domain
MGGDSGPVSELGQATVVVHGDLRDFLPAWRRREDPARIERSLDGRPAVKDVLEAVGVPHPEVGALAVNGEPAVLARQVRPGEVLEAWPAADAARLGLPPAIPPAPEDGEAPRFVLDGHLGRLVAYLRMLGFDTWYRRDAADGLLAAVAAAERRILLTRDRGLLKRSVVRRGAFVRSDRPVDQLEQVVRRFAPVDRWQPFGRCLRCNTPLVGTSREAVLDRLEPLTRIHYDDFRRCPGCDAVYWKGSHHAHMTRLVERVRTDAMREPARKDPG